MMRRFRPGWMVALALLFTAGPAMAQNVGALDRLQRQLDQIRWQTQIDVNEDVPVGQRLYFDYGGLLAFDFLAVDDETGETHILRETSLTLYAHLNLDGIHEVFVRGQFAYEDFNSGDSFDGRGDEWNNELNRAYYKLDLGRLARSGNPDAAADWDVVVTAGRQLIHWKNGLVLSEEIDGAMVEARWKDFHLTAFGGMTSNNVVDFDGSRPNFDTDTCRAFYGGAVGYQIGTHQPYVYGLVQSDHNSDDPLIIGPTTTNFEYDSYYIGVGSTGSIGQHIVYGVEFVYQGGEGLSSSFIDGPVAIAVPQTTEDIEAFAFDFRLDYLFGDANRSRIGVEFLAATGDDDRLIGTDTFGGNRTGTNDTGFNALGLIYTGLAFNAEVTNLLMGRVSGSTFPLPGSQSFARLQIGMDLLVFGKFDPDAPINEPSTDDRFLGVETDFWVAWQITSDLTVSVRYGVFFPGDGIAGDDSARHFFFTGVTYAF